MITVLCAGLIPVTVGVLAFLIHHPDREMTPRAGSSRTGRPGATRGSWSPPSRGEPSAHAVPTVPPATDGPGIKRVL